MKLFITLTIYLTALHLAAQTDSKSTTIDYYNAINELSNDDIGRAMNQVKNTNGFNWIDAAGTTSLVLITISVFAFADVSSSDSIDPNYKSLSIALISGLAGCITGSIALILHRVDVAEAGKSNFRYKKWALISRNNGVGFVYTF